MITELEKATWPELPERPVVMVPLGSTEQHGPHLSFSADSVIVEYVAWAAAEPVAKALGRRVVVAPTLPYGASGEHQGFPGTISIGNEALRLLLVEMIRSLSLWSGPILLINGHGGNALTVKDVVEQMRYERHDVTGILCTLQTQTDAHAGYDETSILLHLEPSLVRMDAATPGNTQPLLEILPDLMRRGVQSVSPTGVLGDPTHANSAMGRTYFHALVDAVIDQATACSEAVHE